MIRSSETESHFLQNVNVINGTAVPITTKLKNVFSSLKISRNKVVCMSSDGASVMVERMNGVAAQLRKLNPTLINIHCAGHPLSLAVSRATNKILYFTNFKANVKFLFNFFHYSAV